MPDSNQANNNPEPLREWTLMFYFASDNPLAPNIVSQLKAIKNAGFHPEVNVVAQFDPNTKDTPTHIFDVNRVNKLKYPGKDDIGFRGDNPYIRNLALDKLWSKEKNDAGELIKAKLTAFLKKGSNGSNGIDYRAPEPELPLQSLAARPVVDGESGNGSAPNNDGGSTEQSPNDSLKSFLKFCAKNYSARHYMLFILGHGLVVGNDMFLFDADAPQHSLSLRNLRERLIEFKGNIGTAELDLIGLHSCSMSSLEVAYELHDIANYMLASQGPAFVGSWPYREILVRVFKDQKLRNPPTTDVPATENIEAPPTIATTIQKIFDYISYNSYDFQLAGYSFDLALCDLRQDLSPLTEALDNLSVSLIDGLQEKNLLARQLIIMAHWEAQSFWQESYTDLYDFCSCLMRGCTKILPISNGARDILLALKDNCDKVQKALKTNATEGLIVQTEFAGPEYQYSHGLSVYFPWSEPVNHHFWTSEYPAYKLNTRPNEEKPNERSWFRFLEEYFKATMRDPVGVEIQATAGRMAVRQPTIEQELLEEITSKIFNKRGQLSSSGGTLDDLPPIDKPGGGSVTGMDCGCPGIKNYPSFTRARRDGDPKGSNPATSLGLTELVQAD